VTTVPDLEVVDARGLRCPLPVIRLGAVLRDRPPATEVLLLATDPAAHTDVAAFCRMRGHELLEVTTMREGEEPAYATYRVRRG
jgi:tRNA 2-thiouridine synthesizing protein A